MSSRSLKPEVGRREIEEYMANLWLRLLLPCFYLCQRVAVDCYITVKASLRFRLAALTQ